MRKHWGSQSEEKTHDQAEATKLDDANKANLKELGRYGG